MPTVESVRSAGCTQEWGFYRFPLQGRPALSSVETARASKKQRAEPLGLTKNAAFPGSWKSYFEDDVYTENIKTNPQTCLLQGLLFGEKQVENW